MRILLVSSNTFSAFGGYEKVIYNVFKNLAEKKNYDFSILSVSYYMSLIKSDILEEFKSFKIYRDSDYRNKFHYTSTILIKKFLNMRFLVDYKTIKHYFSIIDFDIVLITDPLLITSARKVLEDYNLRNKKIIYWDHGTLMYWYHVSLTGDLRSRIRRAVYEKEIISSIREADAFLAISSEIAEEIRRYKEDAIIYLVYNPCKIYEDLLINRPAKPIFIYVGRLDDKPKNISFMLKGFSMLKYKEWELKIIGTGPDEKKLKDLVKKLKISDKVSFEGFKKEPFKDINEATALILTSRFEGLPLVLVEAIQRGIPVISSDCKAGPRDIVINGKNGYLYKEGNLEEFVSTVESVIEGRLVFDSPENIAKTVSKFSEEVVIENIDKALKEVLGK
jgi:UDP-D-galactose:(glucosyl)LPS alpha-1,6-D-galactosyltransferase